MTAGLDPIRDILAQGLEGGRFPGACWWVEVEGRDPLCGVLGSAEVEPGNRELQLDTPFDLASLTKPLSTALLLVLLEQRGKLALDARLDSVLARFRGTPYANVTLLDLATHRSGLPAWSPLYVEATDLDGYLDAIAGSVPDVSRGETRYSDLGYIVLGAVLERVAGRALPQLFDALIARPLGLARAAFAVDGSRAGDAASTECGNLFERMLAGDAGQGHAWREEIPAGEVHDANAHTLGGAAGHAGLFGTCEDVASIAREILCGETLGLAGRQRERLLRLAPDSKDRTVGFVAASASKAARGVLPDDAPGHVGFTGTSLWLDPAASGFYVLLTNRVHPYVETSDFQEIRREFHRAALAAIAGA
ncbi:MAG: beta-lactamase family protein [bacterium]|nr:beta-lactamase family protein [bacterium]